MHTLTMTAIQDSDTGEGDIGLNDYLVYDDRDRVQHLRDFSICRMKSRWLPEAGVHAAMATFTCKRLCDPHEWLREKAPTAAWVIPGSTNHSPGTYFKRLHSEFAGDELLNNMPTEGEAQEDYLNRMKGENRNVYRTPISWLLVEGRKRRENKNLMDTWKQKLESFACPGFVSFSYSV